MHMKPTRFAFATIGILTCWLGTATAQSQNPTGPRCPAGYWLMGSLCLSSSTGDVVNAAPAAPSATAQSQGSTSPRCPAGYWLMESLCLNGSTGDVVNAAPAAPSAIALDPGCAPGYRRLDSLCLSSETGDVELVDEKSWPAAERTAARK
jgi:hypothetical protein